MTHLLGNRAGPDPCYFGFEFTNFEGHLAISYILSLSSRAEPVFKINPTQFFSSSSSDVHIYGKPKSNIIHILKARRMITY